MNRPFLLHIPSKKRSASQSIEQQPEKRQKIESTEARSIDWQYYPADILKTIMSYGIEIHQTYEYTSNFAMTSTYFYQAFCELLTSTIKDSRSANQIEPFKDNLTDIIPIYVQPKSHYQRTQCKCVGFYWFILNQLPKINDESIKIIYNSFKNNFELKLKIIILNILDDSSITFKENNNAVIIHGKRISITINTDYFSNRLFLDKFIEYFFETKEFFRHLSAIRNTNKNKNNDKFNFISNLFNKYNQTETTTKKFQHLFSLIDIDISHFITRKANTTDEEYTKKIIEYTLEQYQSISRRKYKITKLLDSVNKLLISQSDKKEFNLSLFKSAIHNIITGMNGLKFSNQYIVNLFQVLSNDKDIFYSSMIEYIQIAYLNYYYFNNTSLLTCLKNISKSVSLEPVVIELIDLFNLLTNDNIKINIVNILYKIFQLKDVNNQLDKTWFSKIENLIFNDFTSTKLLSYKIIIINLFYIFRDFLNGKHIELLLKNFEDLTIHKDKIIQETKNNYSDFSDDLYYEFESRLKKLIIYLSKNNKLGTTKSLSITNLRKHFFNKLNETKLNPNKISKILSEFAILIAMITNEVITLNEEESILYNNIFKAIIQPPSSTTTEQILFHCNNKSLMEEYSSYDTNTEVLQTWTGYNPTLEEILEEMDTQK